MVTKPVPPAPGICPQGMVPGFGGEGEGVGQGHCPITNWALGLPRLMLPVF